LNVARACVIANRGHDVMWISRMHHYNYVINVSGSGSAYFISIYSIKPVSCHSHCLHNRLSNIHTTNNMSVIFVYRQFLITNLVSSLEHKLQFNMHIIASL